MWYCTCTVAVLQVEATERKLEAEAQAGQQARAEAVGLRSELSAVQSELSQVQNLLAQERGQGECSAPPPLLFILGAL